MAVLAEHGQTADLQAVLINDAFVEMVCARLASLPSSTVSPDEVRRAWAKQREALPKQPDG
jgi:hypothetical protein